MPPAKDLLSYSDDDLNKIISQDFRVSEDDRADRNAQNWQAHRMYHCRDLMDSAMIAASRMRFNPRVSPLDVFAPTGNYAYLPWLRGVLLTSLAMVMNALYPDTQDFFRIDHRHRDDEPAARTMESLVRYFLGQSNYLREVALTILQAHEYDFGILYTTWARELRMVPKMIVEEEQQLDYATGEYIPTGRVKDRRQTWAREAADFWQVYTVNTFNFRYDPMSDHQGFDNCEWAGMTYLMSKRRMHELAEAGVFDKDAVAKIKDDEAYNDGDSEDSTADYDRRLREDEKLSGDPGAAGDDYKKNFVRVRQYHTEFALAYQLNGRVIGGKRRTIGWPFHKIVFVPNTGMFSGTAMAEPLLPIQHDINRALRLIRTQQDRAVNPDLVIDGTFFDSRLEALSQPWNTGATIVAAKNAQGRDVAGVARPVGMPSNTAPDIWNSINLQLDMGARVAGLSANAQSVGEGGKTATEIMQIAASVGSRTDLWQKLMEKSVVVDVLYRMMQLIHINVKKPVIVRLVGEAGVEFREIPPRDLIFNASPDFVALGMSSMASRQSATQLLRDAIIAFSSNPLFAQYLKILPSMRDLFRRFGVDPDQYLNDTSKGERTMPQEWENILLAAGIAVPIHGGDDHAEHLEVGVKYMQDDANAIPEANLAVFGEHLKAHKAMLEGGGKMMGAPSPTAQPVTVAGGAGQGPQRPAGPANAPVSQPGPAAPAERAPAPAPAQPTPQPAAQPPQ